jgi:hypothetical protein
VVASFIADGKKSKTAEAQKVEPMAAPPPQMATFVPAPVATSPPSEGSSSASSDDSGNPVNHSAILWCWFRSTWLRPIRKVQKYVVKAKQPSP